MFQRLKAVTDNYSLVIVNNGFDDPNYLEQLNPRYYIENSNVTGTACAINQALGLLDDEYIAVLRSDVLLYDEGWLDNTVAFLRSRPDVGLVGIAGWHSITRDGVPDLLTPVFRLRGHPDSNKPTWRFTEVACIDDAGWVMRNADFRLSEDMFDTSLFALELSLKYINAGFRLYVAAIDFAYAEERQDATRRFAFAQTDNDEAAPGTPEAVRSAMQMKWEELLPITRGFCDETYVMNKVEELARYVRELEADNAAKADALKHIVEHEAQLESAIATRRTAWLISIIKNRLSGKPRDSK